MVNCVQRDQKPSHHSGTTEERNANHTFRQNFSACNLAPPRWYQTCLTGSWSDITQVWSMMSRSTEWVQRFNRVVTLTLLVLTLGARNCQPGCSLCQIIRCLHVHTLVQMCHLILWDKLPTGHCEKRGRMVTPACPPITRIGASLMLEFVKLEVNLLVLTTSES